MPEYGIRSVLPPSSSDPAAVNEKAQLRPDMLAVPEAASDTDVPLIWPVALPETARLPHVAVTVPAIEAAVWLTIS